MTLKGQSKKKKKNSQDKRSSRNKKAVSSSSSEPVSDEVCTSEDSDLAAAAAAVVVSDAEPKQEEVEEEEENIKAEAEAPPRLERRSSLRRKLGALIKASADLPAAINRGLQPIRRSMSFGKDLDKKPPKQHSDGSSSHKAKVSATSSSSLLSVAQQPQLQAQPQPQHNHNRARSMLWYHSLSSLVEHNNEGLACSEDYDDDASYVFLEDAKTAAPEKNLMQLLPGRMSLLYESVVRRRPHSVYEIPFTRHSDHYDSSIDLSRPPCEAISLPVLTDEIDGNENDQSAKSVYLRRFCGDGFAYKSACGSTWRPVESSCSSNDNNELQELSRISVSRGTALRCVRETRTRYAKLKKKIEVVASTRREVTFIFTLFSSCTGILGVSKSLAGNVLIKLSPPVPNKLVGLPLSHRVCLIRGNVLVSGNGPVVSEAALAALNLAESTWQDAEVDSTQTLLVVGNLLLNGLGPVGVNTLVLTNGALRKVIIPGRAPVLVYGQILILGNGVVKDNIPPLAHGHPWGPGPVVEAPAEGISPNQLDALLGKVLKPSDVAQNQAGANGQAQGPHVPRPAAPAQKAPAQGQRPQHAEGKPVVSNAQAKGVAGDNSKAQANSAAAAKGGNNAEVQAKAGSDAKAGAGSVSNANADSQAKTGNNGKADSESAAKAQAGDNGAANSKAKSQAQAGKNGVADSDATSISLVGVNGSATSDANAKAQAGDNSQVNANAVAVAAAA
ncbi:unnamed protein product [Trichogramma brassicae]|uniref:Uncharacterized protein n=1 Tax=Trichogramma brassicae TaxID=86971 RepID=A0A6H5J2F9_9HYME|nr:unnamed protein product [Trichogramma brassicae]